MSAVEETGRHLFKFFQAALPIPSGSSKARKPDHQAVAAGLAKFYEEARLERDRRRLGVIGRARVALYLQRQLLAAHYPPTLVRQVLFSMLLSSFVGRGR